MKWMLTTVFALAFAGAAVACPMKHQSADADMTRIVASAAPMTVPVDPLPTASVTPDGGSDEAILKGKRAEE